MTRQDFENIVNLLGDDVLTCVLLAAEVDDIMGSRPEFEDEVETALHGRKGVAQLTPEEARKAVVDYLVGYFDEEEISGEEIAELIDEQVKLGKHWVDTIAEWRKERADGA